MQLAKQQQQQQQQQTTIYQLLLVLLFISLEMYTPTLDTIIESLFESSPRYDSSFLDIKPLQCTDAMQGIVVGQIPSLTSAFVTFNSDGGHMSIYSTWYNSTVYGSTEWLAMLEPLHYCNEVVSLEVVLLNGRSEHETVEILEGVNFPNLQNVNIVFHDNINSDAPLVRLDNLACKFLSLPSLRGFDFTFVARPTQPNDYYVLDGKQKKNIFFSLSFHCNKQMEKK
jgi:hypothetical protein